MLTTQRAIIRPLEENDFEALIEMYLEPDSNKFIAPLRDKNKNFYTTFLKTKIKNNQEKIGFWTVVETATNKIIGTVNLNYFEPLAIHHIGCHLKRNYWNLGFATELLHALIEYGKDQENYSPIHGLVESGNYASKKLMEKLGLTYSKTEWIKNSEILVYQLTN